MKSTYFQNYVCVLFVITLVIGAVLAHFGIPLIGILGSFFLGNVICRLMFNKWWNGEISSTISPIKKWMITGLVSLAASQIGWVALLI